MSDFDLGHRTGVKATTAGALFIGGGIFAFTGQAVLAGICAVLLFFLIARA